MLFSASDRLAASSSSWQPSTDAKVWNASAGAICASVVNPSARAATATTTETIQAAPTINASHPPTLSADFMALSLLGAQRAHHQPEAEHTEGGMKRIGQHHERCDERRTSTEPVRHDVRDSNDRHEQRQRGSDPPQHRHLPSTTFCSIIAKGAGRPAPFKWPYHRR